MKKKLPLVCSLAMLSAVLVVQGAAPTEQAQTSSTNAQADVPAQQALIDQFCLGCHSQRGAESGVDSSLKIALDSLDLTKVSTDAEAWERVIRRLNAGMMPPVNMRRPDDPNALFELAAYLEGEIDRDAEDYLAPPGLHRLNRTEYANAIRDILGFEIDPASYLPSDDSSFGFDNMAGTLGLSSTLVEAYVSAAGKISRLAIGEEATPRLAIYRVAEDTSQDYHIEGLPFGTRGGILVNHIFPSGGEYTLSVTPIFGDNMSPQSFGTVSDEKIEILVDGELLELMDWAGNRPGQGVAFGGDRDGGNGMEVTFETTGGPHEVGVTFLATNFAPLLDLNRQFERKTIQTGPTPGYTFFPHVGSIRIEGPFNSTAPQTSLPRDRVFICKPASEADEAACAGEIITNLATEAYRRPITDADLAPLMDFYEMGRAELNFDHGIEMALARILAAPQFIYRIEDEPSDLGVGDTYRVSELELASRLSYFLWSRGPDAQLVELASSGRLSDPGVLEDQVLRMLADPRSEALAENFAGQWLNLRGIQSHSPLPMIYPDFDDPLRQAMRREVELLFDSIIREDRSIVELLTADYTFVNERLASHYGIPNIYGSQFRRITLGEEFDVLRGLTGKGVILSTTAKPDRTSPVTRGKWVMTNILGVSPPDPPPNVPPLPPPDPNARGANADPSMRQKMLDHRVRTDCTQCHQLMDPIGFALENFDGIALWRTDDNGPIDSAATLFDGTTVGGPSELRDWLVSYSDSFVQVAIEKLLTYALGRGVEYQDMPVVRAIANAAAENDNRISSLVLGVVNSAPFSMNAKLLASGEE